MDRLEKLISDYLNQSHMMQIATFEANQPWVATVFYVTDDELNLCWASPGNTRHSRNIRENHKVAAAIPVVHEKNQPVVGLQIEGVASLIDDAKTMEEVAKRYAAEFSFGEKWIKKICSGQTKHKLYKLNPTKFVLFDDINYPENPRQEWEL